MKPRHEAEFREGPEAAKRFQSMVNQIISVTKDELAKRERAQPKPRRAPKNRRHSKSTN
jgi:hypothetical protein